MTLRGYTTTIISQV